MKLILATFFLVLSMIVGCTSNPQPTSGNAGSAASSTRAEPTPNSAPATTDNSKVCALFSAADAQQIMGVPMKPKPGRGQNVCMYEEVAERPNTIGPGTVALTLNQSTSPDEENKAWAQLKEVRHLQAGQKNVQVLTGIGDEAFFTGNIEKGKVGVSAVVARKGKSHFAIDVMVLEYIASPVALKASAKKIADPL